MLEKEHFQKLANQLMFELSEEETENIQKEFKTFMKQIESFDKIDTSSVEPMIYPFEEAVGVLREDEEAENLSIEDVLLNAPESKDNYFVVPKVVD